MPSTQSLIARTGLAVAAAASVFVASTADAGLHNGTRWLRFDQAQVLRVWDPAAGNLPALSLPRLTYLPNERDPNPQDGTDLVEHPVVIYYTILTDGMLDVEEITGEDNVNALNIATDNDVENLIDVGSGVRDTDDGFIGQPFLATGGTVDNDNDTSTPPVPACFVLSPEGIPQNGVDNAGPFGPGPVVTTACDTADDEDGITESWPTDGVPAVIDLIPPPAIPGDLIAPPGTTDEGDLARLAVYRYYGLGNAAWGEDRFLFPFEDGEAIWRLAQSQYGPQIGTGEIGFNESLPFAVVEEEEAAIIIQGLRNLEKVMNVRFVQRNERPTGGVSIQGPLEPPTTLSGTFRKTVAIDPAINGLDIYGGEILNGVDPGGNPFNILVSGDAARDPNDDYPWILFTGAPEVDSEPMGVSGLSKNSGSGRGPLSASPDLGHPDLDYVFDDVNGDGFPDHVDFDGDDAPDALVLSQGGAPGVVATATTGVRDFATNDIFAGAALTTVTDAFGNVLNVRSGPPFADFNGDGILDAPMQVVGEIGINPAALSVTAAGVPHVPNAYDAGIAGGPDVNGDLIPDGDGIPEFIEFPSIDPTVLDEFGDPADLGELDVLSNLPADGFESLRVLDVPVVAGSSFTARLGPTTAVQGTGNGVGERIPTSHVYFVNFNISTVMHEVMHQLGYQHEQKRLDREDFVFVDFGNIPPDLAAQFFVAPGDRILGVPFDSNGDGVDDTYDYDFESLMHYGRCGALFGSTCSADQLAMEVLPPFGAFQDVIGSTDIISAGDLVSLQEVYLKPQVFVDAPCLADLNQDNRITFEDILEFINLYLPCADPSVNPIPGSTLPNDPCRIVDEVLGNFDGFVDTLDLINYFTLFRASRGCTPRTVVPIGPGTPVGDNSLSPI